MGPSAVLRSRLAPVMADMEQADAIPARPGTTAQIRSWPGPSTRWARCRSPQPGRLVPIEVICPVN
jgi:hypothetical protein